MNLITQARSVIQRREVVFVYKVTKDAGDHYVTKVTIGTQNFYQAGMAQSKPEVAGLKGHSFPFAD